MQNIQRQFIHSECHLLRQHTLMPPFILVSILYLKNERINNSTLVVEWDSNWSIKEVRSVFLTANIMTGLKIPAK